MDLPEKINPDDLKKMSDEQLMEVISDSLAMSANGLQRAAEAIGELERRGRDLSEIRFGIMPLLRKIGSGQLMPQAVEKFAGKFTLLNKIAALPLSDQARIIGDEPLAVARGKDGKFDSFSCTAANMAPDLIRLVFASDHIRTVEEQIAVLRARDSAQPKLVPDGEIKLDRKRRGIVVGGVFVPVESLKRYVQQLD